MNGIIIVNQSIGHNQYKIDRFVPEFNKRGINVDVFINNGTLAEIKNNNIIINLPKADFVLYLDKDMDLDKIEYNFKYIEYPNKKRNAYGIIAIGKLNMSKDELYNHFEKYKEYLEQCNLDIEFINLIFLKKGHAIKEFDTYTNPKRDYLRELISKEEYEETKIVKDKENG